MEIKIIVEDNCGNSFRTTTTIPEIAEMQLRRFIEVAGDCMDYDCSDCDNCEDYPSEYEDDMDEIILQKAEELKAKRSLLKILKDKKNDL